MRTAPSNYVARHVDYPFSSQSVPDSYARCSQCCPDPLHGLATSFCWISCKCDRESYVAALPITLELFRLHLQKWAGCIFFITVRSSLTVCEACLWFVARSHRIPHDMLMRILDRRMNFYRPSTPTLKAARHKVKLSWELSRFRRIRHGSGEGSLLVWVSLRFLAHSAASR